MPFVSAENDCFLTRTKAAFAECGDDVHAKANKAGHINTQNLVIKMFSFLKGIYLLNRGTDDKYSDVQRSIKGLEALVKDGTARQSNSYEAKPFDSDSEVIEVLNDRDNKRRIFTEYVSEEHNILMRLFPDPGLQNDFT